MCGGVGRGSVRSLGWRMRILNLRGRAPLLLLRVRVGLLWRHLRGGWFGKNSEEEVPAHVGFEGGGDDDIGARRDFKARRYFARIDVRTGTQGAFPFEKRHVHEAGVAWDLKKMKNTILSQFTLNFVTF